MRRARLVLPALCVSLFLSGSPAAADEPPADVNAPRREQLLDVAITALYRGDAATAERALREAAALPGDPARAAMAASLADRVAHLRPAAPAPAGARPDREGRVPFLLTTTALGLGLYGWTLPNTLGVSSSNSTRSFVGIYMFTAAASFALPYWATLDGPVTAAQANLAFYGGTRGIFHGLLLGGLVAGNLSPDRRFQGWNASLMLGSAAELAGGYYFARARALTPGEAHTIAAVGDLGLFAGITTGFLLGADRADSEDAQARAMSAAGLLGSAIGLGGGYALARQRDNSWGDAEVMRAAGVLGAFAGLTVGDLVARHAELDDRAFTAPLLVGGLVGVGLGDRLVRDTDFSVGQSLIVDLATFAGGAVGAGVTFLAAPGGTSERPYLLATTAGGALGLALSYWALHDRPEGPATARLGRALGPQRVSLWPLVGRDGQRGLALGGAF